MRILCSTVLLLLGCAGLFTPEENASSERFSGDASALFFDCSDTIVSAPVWQGEYPSPVVFLHETTQLNGFEHPCHALQESARPCTAPEGLYHPWGGHGPGFVTLRGLDRFAVLRSVDVDGVSLEPGDQVIVRAYYGEGFCGMVSNDEEFSDMCPEFWTDDEGDLFQSISSSDVERQFFLAQCTNGNPAWIEVTDALFANEHVEAGNIIGYGEVAPPGTGESIF